MRTRNTRISAALLIVFTSLLLASIACYSGQAGLFELTPYYTPTPMPVAENPLFSVMQIVLAPREPGKTFFYLTTDPEPLASNLVNSKQSCTGDLPAQILYAAQNDAGEHYYLVLCGGAVGWVAEERLAGPLLFDKDDLAIAIASGTGPTASVALLDDFYRPLPFNPLQTCKPESIVRVTDLMAADPDGDGQKQIYYKIECPTTAGPLKGFVTEADLVGPMEVDINERAIAVDPPDSTFRFASEPAPVTDANAVESDCRAGDILTAKQVVIVDEVVYYNMTCGDSEGWVGQEQFVGPLRYDPGMNTAIYIPPIQVFVDEVVQPTGEVEPVEDEAVPEETPAEATGETAVDQRRTAEVSPPLYLTNAPGPAIPVGEDANVVGQCDSGRMASIERYAAADTIYYYVTCDACVEWVTDEEGVTSCASYQSATGWADQVHLQGPLTFAIGQKVVYTERSAANETDENGVTWSRIPPTVEGATTLGAYTRYGGRCLRDEGVEITGVVVEKDRTRNRFSFFYAIQCMGQTSTIVEEREGSVVRPKVSYNDDNELITGYAAERDLQALAD